MKISGEIKGGALFLSLSGELDHHGAKEVMASAAEIIDEHVPRNCVMDFKDVGFMDSSGIALILNVNKRLGNIGGRLRVENVARQPMKVIKASGIERIVSIKEQ
ncbi:MAG: STAS domain-containing protein [Oscillospiraceae bacterium]|nr:STAS domain-containing protein [Oscillospiraceae bacterium]